MEENQKVIIVAQSPVVAIFDNVARGLGTVAIGIGIAVVAQATTDFVVKKYHQYRLSKKNQEG